MILHLHVIEASDIPVMDNDKSDPYCVIQLIPQSDFKAKTEVVFNSLSPKWNQEFYIPISNVQISSLYLSMYDKDEYKDDIISTLILPIGTMQVGMIIDQWYTMIPSEQVHKGGMIHLVTQLMQNNQSYSQPGTYQQAQITSPIPGQYVPQQSSYPPQQIPYNQQYPQQQPQYPQQQQFQQYGQPQQYSQQQFYAGQPINPGQMQTYPPQQGQYYPNQPIYPQQGAPSAPYSPYDDIYNTPPPPRPPGMKDENYKKLQKAQKKMLKKLAKGDIKGCLKNGMKCILKI